MATEETYEQRITKLRSIQDSLYCVKEDLWFEAVHADQPGVKENEYDKALERFCNRTINAVQKSCEAIMDIGVAIEFLEEAIKERDNQ